MFTEEVWAYYDALVKELREARGNFTLVENAYHRMRQLTSGYLSFKDPEKAGHEVVFKDNPKVAALLELVNELPTERKLLIVTHYVKTGELLSAALKTAKVKNLRLYGGTKDKQGTIDKFKKDPSIRALVLNAAAGGVGLNLQVANYVIFFESPSDPSMRTQVIKRTQRDGQLRRVFVWDILVKGSIDMRIYKSVRQGIDLFKEIIDGSDVI